MRAATLEIRLEGLGVLRSFSKPRVSNDNPYNDRHRNGGIRFATPSQRHSEAAVAISRHRAHAYEQALQRHRRHWSRPTRCWKQPEVVLINPPTPVSGITVAMLVVTV
ncbi:MAG: hypothetical protein QM522_04365 [Chitinophagaceae bacterium]|nr:hypothetical protein [Chitinophagaceae bacterium]